MNRLRETANISNECKLRLASLRLLGSKIAGVSLLLKTIDGKYKLRSLHYYGSSERNQNDFETLLSLGLKAKAFV
jgi:hypothetical protein